MDSTSPPTDTSVLERIGDGILILDQDWRVIFINAGGAKLLGRTSESLLGEIYWEQFPQGVGRIFDVEFRRAMQLQEPGEFNGYSPSLGCWYHVRTFPSPDTLMLIFQDVTQRHDADDAIRRLLEQLQRQRRLATVLAETNEIVFRADSTVELLRAATSIAVEHGGFVMAWIGVIDPITGVLELVAYAGEGAQEYLRDGFITTRDEPHGRGVGGHALRLGEDMFTDDILIDASMAPWRDAAERVGYRSSGAFPLRINGEVRGLLSVYAREPSYFNEDERNLVHRLAANVAYGWESLQREEDLRESDVARRTAQRFRAILSAAPDAILGLDLAGRIEMASDRVRELFGCSPDVIIGTSIEDLISFNGEGKESDQWFDRLSHNDSSVISEGLSARRHDGSCFPAEVAWSSLVDEPGTATIILSVRDLTERLELEERRRQFALEAQREQQDRLDSLGRLAGGIAHDFNNLLGVILNYVTLIERDELTSQTRHDIAQVRGATERGAALTRQLLTFARSETTHAEVVDVTDAARNVAHLLERTLGPGIDLQLELSSEPLLVLIDPQQLDQVIVNLAINARDAMPEGGRLLISTEQKLDSDLPNVLRVRDTGIGMSRDVTSRVFEPFFTTKPRGQGTGLGLATVYGVVSRAGGRISIDSQPGEGTTFEIEFPVSDEPDVRHSPPAAGVTTLRSGRILLVDDDLQIRDTTRRILRDAGYDVRVASDGREALDVLADFSFEVDVVVSDVVMPHLSGIELADHLEQHAPHVPVVLMSGYDSARGPLERRVLLKPVDEHTLLQSVEEALRER